MAKDDPIYLEALEKAKDSVDRETESLIDIIMSAKTSATSSIGKNTRNSLFKAIKESGSPDWRTLVETIQDADEIIYRSLISAGYNNHDTDKKLADIWHDIFKYASTTAEAQILDPAVLKGRQEEKSAKIARYEAELLAAKKAEKEKKQHDKDVDAILERKKAERNVTIISDAPQPPLQQQPASPTQYHSSQHTLAEKRQVSATQVDRGVDIMAEKKILEQQHPIEEPIPPASGTEGKIRKPMRLGQALADAKEDADRLRIEKEEMELRTRELAEKETQLLLEKQVAELALKEAQMMAEKQATQHALKDAEILQAKTEAEHMLREAQLLSDKQAAEQALREEKLKVEKNITEKEVKEAELSAKETELKAQRQEIELNKKIEEQQQLTKSLEREKKLTEDALKKTQLIAEQQKAEFTKKEKDLLSQKEKAESAYKDHVEAEEREQREEEEKMKREMEKQQRLKQDETQQAVLKALNSVTVGSQWYPPSENLATASRDYYSLPIGQNFPGSEFIVSHINYKIDETIGLENTTLLLLLHGETAVALGGEQEAQIILLAREAAENKKVIQMFQEEARKQEY